MTPRQHIVAAIATLKSQQSTIQEELPALIKQVETMRSAQGQMDRDILALETALAAIDGSTPSGKAVESTAEAGAGACLN